MTKFPGMALRRQNKSLKLLEKANKLYRMMTQQCRCCTWNSDDLKPIFRYLMWLLPFTNFDSYLSTRSESFRLYVLSFKRNLQCLHCCPGQSHPHNHFVTFELVTRKQNNTFGGRKAPDRLMSLLLAYWLDDLTNFPVSTRCSFGIRDAKILLTDPHALTHVKQGSCQLPSYCLSLSHITDVAQCLGSPCQPTDCSR